MANVIIYEHANYQGRSQELPIGQYDNALGQISIGNDTLSSIKVPNSLVARIYEHFLFRGEFIDIRTNTPAVSLPWNDRASSIVIFQDGRQPSIKPYGPVVGVNSLEASSGGGAGVYGESRAWNAVRGVTYAPGHAAVVGLSEVHNPDPGGQPQNNPGPGVLGQSDGTGVWGTSKTWVGVYGETQSTVGGPAVMGQHHQGGSAVYGLSERGIGVHGRGGRLAGFFEGDVEVTGDIRLTNADCAEDFSIGTAIAVEPGTVMILGEDGALFPSERAYDKRVAGVISGAGSYKPGIVLDKQSSKGKRQPVALLGKVYCKADASYATIEIGDLLTTSPTPGHAMKAVDPARSFGAVIGKTLQPLKEGRGLIPVLIALQ
jgi:hypothetical protein